MTDMGQTVTLQMILNYVGENPKEKSAIARMVSELFEIDLSEAKDLCKEAIKEYKEEINWRLE